MWGAIISAIAGAAIGGAVQGITAYETTEQKVGAYKRASDDVRNATNKYSGKNALDTMVASGKDYATEMGNAVGGQMVADNIAPTGPGVTGAGANANAYNRAQNVGNAAQSAAQSGFGQGVSNAQNMNNALYNKETVGAQQAMNQADINYNVANQAVQEGMNTVGNVAQAYNTIKSDERLKDDEQASVEDALRQIESINYKYKPETGLDQDEHVGVTAQSVEGTALDNGMVSEDENGYKQLDKQKLMESIFAAQAALQKQIDELKNSDNDDKFTSDENCKNIENAIESNPQEAAQVLPQGSAIQQEAVQAIDGGKDAEVNNKTVDRWYENLDLKTKRTLNKDAKPVLDKLLSLKMNEPGYEEAVNDYKNYAKENGFFPGLNYSNPNRGKLSIGDILFTLGEDFYNPPTYDPYEFTDWALDKMNPKQPEPEPVDPVTAAMNAGLSEDDDDYFTSDKRCKDIEKKIESGEELPETAPEELKKEAEQLTDDDKRNDEVNNEVVKKAIGSSFLPDIPTKEVSQQEYNDMSIEDLEKADAEAMKGEGDYITIANDLGLDENDLYYFEDPSFVNELTEEQKEEIKNEPDKEKKIGLLNKIKEAISSFSTGESELDINTGDVANSENASTPLTSGVSPISPSFASGSNGAGVDASNNVGDVETEVETKDSKAHSTSANEIDVAEKEQNNGSMNGANQNEHLDDTFDNLSFEETKHNKEVKSNEQFELDGTEGHTSDSNEGIQLPELNSAEDVKKAIIEDSKNWDSENSGSRFLPFKFTVIGDEVIVSQIGTARKEDFDLFAKDEPGSVNQIKAALSNK